MHRGWIKLWRRQLDSPIWDQPPLYLKTWTWLMLRADRRSGALSTTLSQLAEAVQWHHRGQPGNGKSSLAVAILRHTVERTLGRCHVRYWNIPLGLSRLRHQIQERRPEGESLLDLTGNHLLVLDDLGQQKTSPWVAERFYTLIDAAWSQQKQLVVTTNLTPAAIQAAYQPALVSRLTGLCHPVVMRGSDLRQQPSDLAGYLDESLRPPIGPELATCLDDALETPRAADPVSCLDDGAARPVGPTAPSRPSPGRTVALPIPDPRPHPQPPPEPTLRLLSDPPCQRQTSRHLGPCRHAAVMTHAADTTHATAAHQRPSTGRRPR